MYKIIYLILTFISINIQPIFAQTQSIQTKTNLSFFSQKFLGVKNEVRYSNKSKIKLDLRYDLKNTSSQLSLDYNGDGKYTLDGSYLQHTLGIIIFGVGSVDRHWSFSKNTSLILSKNARPTKSVYLKLENNFKNDWLPLEAKWSLEAFNGFTDGSLNNAGSLLTGIRVILNPVKGLDFELIQTSQWGGKGQSTGMASLGAILFSDTNVGSNANINKMAGFGISYKIPTKIIPLRIYGQTIGEDEAGSLPSCYAYLAGLEWSTSKFKYPVSLNFEVIDTRVNYTTHGNCGPNTMYNNNTYDYTNYGKTMGTAIDSEGSSLDLYVRSQISERINIEFATQSVVVNNNNWQGHRLSSNRQSGFISSLGVSWVKNNIKFNGNIYSQDFDLDKANIKKGYGVGFSASLIF